jgi:fusion and transport protein UGO1
MKKYDSIWHGLTTIYQEEHYSNILGLWFGPHLFLPTLVQHLSQPLFQHITPILTDRLWFRSRKASTLAAVALELGISTLELLFIMPVETVRRRLQCQSMRKTPIDDREFITVVPLAPMPYSSAYDCAWRIVTQESSGIAGLYRGFKARFQFTLIIALLQILNLSLMESQEFTILD